MKSCGHLTREGRSLTSYAAYGHLTSYTAYEMTEGRPQARGSEETPPRSLRHGRKRCRGEAVGPSSFQPSEGVLEGSACTVQWMC